MRTKKTAVRSRAARIGVVLAVTAAGLVSTGAPSFAVITPAALTPTVTQGPSGGLNTFSVTAPAPPVPGTEFKAGLTFVEFQAVGAAVTTGASVPATGTTGCWPSWLTPITPLQSGTTAAPLSVGVVAVAGGGAVVFSPNKLYITVPTALALAPLVVSPAIPAQTTAKYNICVYSAALAGQTSGIPTTASGIATAAPLIAQTTTTAGAYSIANKATYTSIVPATGPAQGRTTITVNGTNFSAAATPTVPGMTATLGGTPLGIIAVDPAGLWFTANLPPHTASATPVDLVITTAGGPYTAPSVFTYTNGIVAMPSNEPNTQPKLSYITVQGVGFSGLNFTNTSGTTPDGSGAHVYLVDGIYDPTIISSPNRKRIGETAECVDVRVVTDTELNCSPYPGVSVDPTTGATATATHTLKVSYAAAGGLTLTAVAPDTLTAADQGLLVTGADIPAGTLITTVASNVATIDTAVTGTGSAVGGSTVTISARPFIATTASTANLTVVTTTTTVPTTFAAYDVGRVVTGAGVTPVPFNTTLVSQTGAAGVLTGSVATGTTQPMFIGNAAPVPTGVYTVTVVSDGLPASTTFTTSIISSGSTYTVAPY